MNTVIFDKKDEIVMRLVHYFVTYEDYTPIIVNGTKNEVWLENTDADYQVIRINSNYIHNEEQLKFDNFKIKNVVKQIKKKTFTFKMKSLNILLDVRDDFDCKNTKDIENIKLKNSNDIKKNKALATLFPNIKDKWLEDTDKVNFLVNVTNDINEKTKKKNEVFEKVFSPKKIIATKVLIVINIIMFLLTLIGEISGAFNLGQLLALHPVYAFGNFEFYRLITSTFMHANILHLAFNMYVLYVIGNQLENFVGTKKFTIIYLISGLTASIFSCVLTKGWSVGASGAVFGLMGSLLYFGFNYRNYLGDMLRSQIVPLIAINLVLGFLNPSTIDNAAHIGGLVGGYLFTMAIGISKESPKKDRINGLIVYLLLIAFFIYIIYR